MEFRSYKALLSDWFSAALRTSRKARRYVPAALPAIASFVKQINETQRPMVLTQRGRGVAVLVGVREYQRMQERLELLEDIHRSEAQIEAGEGVPQAQAKDMILRNLRQ